MGLEIQVPKATYRGQEVPAPIVSLIEVEAGKRREVGFVVIESGDLVLTAPLSEAQKAAAGKVVAKHLERSDGRTLGQVVEAPPIDEK